MESIAKRGLTETTITHISKGASMSRGIINFYFTSKEMMMREVLAYLIGEYEASWMNAMNKAEGARAKLNVLIEAHFDRKVCSSKRLNVMSAFWGHAASHDAYREKIDASDAKLCKAIEALWRELAPKGYDPQQFAFQLHALIRGMWLSYLLAPKTTDREKLAAQCVAFVEQHVAPLRVVSANPKPKAPAAPVQIVAPKVKPKPKARAKKKDDGQMDIEDLFANG